MNLFELTLKINGFPIVAAKRKLNEIQQINEGNFEEYVKNKRKEIVDYHTQNNTYYKKFVGNVDVSAWEKIPVMTKKDLQFPLEERLSKGFSKKKYIRKQDFGLKWYAIYFCKRQIVPCIDLGINY